MDDHYPQTNGTYVHSHRQSRAKHIGHQIHTNQYQFVSDLGHYNVWQASLQTILRIHHGRGNEETDTMQLPVLSHDTFQVTSLVLLTEAVPRCFEARRARDAFVFEFSPTSEYGLATPEQAPQDVLNHS